MLFQLPADDMLFPDPRLAEEDGLLAIGGDLRAERLITAYQSGIFPWFSEESPILWYAPAERFVLFPQDLRISKSMRQVIAKKSFSWTINQAFEKVILHCSGIARKDQDGTWITRDMIDAYTQLHQLGYAHSIEVWNASGQLAGGLYGVKVGRIFCGESMFSLESNASKYAFIQLAQHPDIQLIDCQIHSDHLYSMGADFIPAEAFYVQLAQQEMKSNDFKRTF